MWTYSITTHTLARDGVFISSGPYSGYPPFTNKADSIKLVGKGPLPPGDYTILPAYDHPHLGPIAMPLSPHPDNEMFQRGSFFIHGENPRHVQFSSDGCIIAYHEIRQMISNSTDRLLRVQV